MQFKSGEADSRVGEVKVNPEAHKARETILKEKKLWAIITAFLNRT